MRTGAAGRVVAAFGQSGFIKMDRTNSYGAKWDRGRHRVRMVLEFGQSL